MVQAISVIAIILFVAVSVIVITADVRPMIRSIRYERYVRKQTIKQATCKHEHDGLILDDRVCTYCGKVLR